MNFECTIENYMHKFFTCTLKKLIHLHWELPFVCVLLLIAYLFVENHAKNFFFINRYAQYASTSSLIRNSLDIFSLATHWKCLFSFIYSIRCVSSILNERKSYFYFCQIIYSVLKSSLFNNSNSIFLTVLFSFV